MSFIFCAWLGFIFFFFLLSPFSFYVLFVCGAVVLVASSSRLEIVDCIVCYAHSFSYVYSRRSLNLKPFVFAVLEISEIFDVLNNVKILVKSHENEAVLWVFF